MPPTLTSVRTRLIGLVIVSLLPALGLLLYSFWHNWQHLFLNLSVLGLAVALFLALVWAGIDAIILRRVRVLLHATEALAAGDLGTRTGVVIGRDELAQLMRAFDAMAVSRESRERQFEETQSALRESETRYRLLFEAVPQPVIVFDVETLEIVAVNEAAIAHYGYSSEEFLAMTMADIRPSEDVPAFRDGLRSAPPEQPRAGIWRHLKRDGTLIDVEILTHALQFAGHPARLGLATDITERKANEERLQGLVELLRQLDRRLQSAREEERSEISREIHDELGQMLTVLKMDLAWLRIRLSRAGDGTERGPLLDRMEAMSSLVDSTVETVRAIATKLRPGLLDTLGLVAAIAWQGREFQERTGIVCEIASEVEELPVIRECATAVFRIFQETLTNVARHARADHVRVRFHPREGFATLEVQDNGIGMSENAITGSASLGLLGMKERALLFGGEVHITSAPGRGTTVTVKIPLDGASGGWPRRVSGGQD